MRKFLLTLVAVFATSWAFAEEIPVVTSVDELANYPDSTLVEFQNIEVTVKEVDLGYYVQTIYCLSDDSTQIGGNIYGSYIPAKFTAVGFVHTVNDYTGTYRQFCVDSLVSVAEFETLGQLLNFAAMESFRNAVENSASIIAKSGTAVITSVYEDYAFFYTIVNTGWYDQQVYGVLKYADADQNLVIGDEVTASGGFKGKVIPTVVTYDESWNETDHKGGYYEMDSDVYLYATNWSAVPIAYMSYSFSDFSANYVREAYPIRIPGGGVIVEEDGKYFYSVEYTTEQYVEGTGWVEVEMKDSIPMASVYVDLAEYVDVTVEDFLVGVWDYRNTGDEDRLLLNGFLSKEAEYDYISEFLAKGEQYEEEIITIFNNPLKVTYKYDDENWKFILMVEDETGALALDFSEAVSFDDNGEPTADYAALRAIQAGDSISGVKGFAQYYVSGQSPRIMCSVFDWNTYETTTYLPTVVSSGAEVKPMMTVTVGEMLADCDAAQNNNEMPLIANKVVRVLDAQVLDTLDQWGYEVKYLIQGTDTMELSNLWGEDKMNFTTYERNNIVGIADFCCINTNYIYQLQPLSQEHITDASLIPEVSTPEELMEYEGTPVIYRGAEVTRVLDMWWVDYYIDGEVRAYINMAGVFDLKGIYEDGGFTVEEIVTVHGFESIGDLDSYTMTYPETAGTAYEIFGSMLVTQVEGSNVYVQYDGISAYGSMVEGMGNVLLGVNADVKKGDLIKGVKGVSTALKDSIDEVTYNWFVIRGSYFTVAADADITVESSDNEIVYNAGVPVNYMLTNAANYACQAINLKCAGGTLTNEDGKYFYTEEAEEYNYETGLFESKPYSIEIVPGDVDLTALVGTAIVDQMWSGVFDYKNATADDVKFYLHKTGSTLLEYETIKDFIDAGYIDGMTSVLVNPVTVTYVHNGGEWGPYYVFVEDGTAGLRVDLYDAATIENIKIGDQITNLKGTCQSGWTGLVSLMGYGDKGDYPLNVTGTVDVTPIDVTIEQLNAEAVVAYENMSLMEPVTVATYASRLVKLSNVSLSKATDSYGDERDCLIDANGNTLLIDDDFVNNYTTYESMDVTGIVDWGGSFNYSQLYTIYPRSQEDINDAMGVEAVDVVGGIYLDAAKRVVANGAVAVVVYDMNGRTVAAANAAIVDAEGLAQGVYVVRATYADGEVATAKVVR